MDKKELVSIISDVLQPCGFKRKGIHWVVNGQELNKIVDLQKSKFGNVFYINYGFIIKSIPLDGWKTHIFSGLGSKVKKEQKRITKLLNLDSDILDETRTIELKNFLIEKMVPKIQEINTEEDVLNKLKERSHLNDVPLVVKKHFNLVE